MINFLKKLADWQIYIALAGGVFYWTGYMLLVQKFAFPPPDRLFFVTFSTFFIYNLNRNSFLHQGLQLFLVFFLLTLTALFFLPWDEVIFLLHLGLISLLYHNPWHSKISLRKIPYLKVFVIAYIWAASSVVLPVFHINTEPLFSDILLIFLAHYIFIFALSLIFDLKDVAYDQSAQLVTMPSRWGRFYTKVLSIFLLLLFGILLLIYQAHLYPVISLTLLNIIALLTVSSHRSRHFYYLVIDGLIIMYFLVVALVLYQI
ncbi:MAG: hypothetical protein ACNS62_13945 [Candidatus Cyclobacteriaceae bacterium M3_2C_046]